MRQRRPLPGGGGNCAGPGQAAPPKPRAQSAGPGPAAAAAFRGAAGPQAVWFRGHGRATSAGDGENGGGASLKEAWRAAEQPGGSVAEWSKALDLGSSHFDGVGSNPTAAKLFCPRRGGSFSPPAQRERGRRRRGGPGSAQCDRHCPGRARGRGDWALSVTFVKISNRKL